MHGSTKSRLFNKSCALKGVNRAKLMEDRLVFVFGESRPKLCHEAGLLLLHLQNDHQPFFFSVFLFFSPTFS